MGVLRVLRHISLVAGILFLAQPTAAQTAPQQSHLDPVEQFTQTYPEAFVATNSDTGEIEFLSGFRISGFLGTPAEVAAAAVDRLALLLGIDTSHSPYSVSHLRSSSGGGHRFRVRIKRDRSEENGPSFVLGVDRPVKGRRYYVTQDGDVAPPGFVFIETDDDRLEIGRRDDWYVYYILRSRVFDRQQPVLATEESADKMSVAGIDNSPYRPTFDSGFDLRSRRTEYLEQTCNGNDYSSTASGRVYWTNPLNGDPVEVQLNDLCDQYPLTLSGSTVSIEPEGRDPAISTNSRFDFQPNDPGFDEVTAYFHINNYFSMLFTRGISASMLMGWNIDVVTRSTYTSSLKAEYRYAELKAGIPYHPYRNGLYEAAIVAHEATHLLMYDHISASYLACGEKEHWAMGESYADYLGLVYRSHQQGHMEPWREPVIGVYHAVETTADLPRDLTTPGTHMSGYATANYVGNGDPGQCVNLYDNSMIFSTALMDYDRNDGSRHSSSFVIESLLNMEDAPTFEVGAWSLIAAVQHGATAPLENGPGPVQCENVWTCVSAVIQAFQSRGILPADLDIEPIIGGSREAIPELSPLSTTSTYPNPFSTSAVIKFAVRDPRTVKIRIYNAEGRLVEHLFEEHVSGGEHSVSWSPKGLPSGPYFYEIDVDGYFKRGSLLFVK